MNKMNEKTIQSVIKAFKDSLHISVKKISALNKFKETQGDNVWVVYPSLQLAKEASLELIKKLIDKKDFSFFKPEWILPFSYIELDTISTISEEYAQKDLDDLNKDELHTLAGNLEKYETILQNLADIVEFKMNLKDYTLDKEGDTSLETVVIECNPIGSILDSQLQYTKEKIATQNDIKKLEKQLDRLKINYDYQLQTVTTESQITVKENFMAEWKKGLKKPFLFLTKKLGLKSPMAYLKLDYVQIDTDAFLPFILKKQGIEYFLGPKSTIQDLETGITFLAFQS